MSSEVAVGDLDSDERGSGARMNGDKLPLELIPVATWINHWKDVGRLESLTDSAFVSTLYNLSNFQQDKLSLNMTVASFEAMDDAVRVFDYGRGKYAAWNWLKGMPWSVPLGCALRHAKAIIEDREEIDPESGLPHIGHFYCNTIMLDTFRHSYPEGNDLPDPKYFQQEGRSDY